MDRPTGKPGISRWAPLRISTMGPFFMVNAIAHLFILILCSYNRNLKYYIILYYNLISINLFLFCITLQKISYRL